MRIFISGSSGLIGNALAQRLEREGHEVIRGVRDEAAAAALHPAACVKRFDFSDPPDWGAGDLLAGVDVVVNATGIFRETGRQSFNDIHVKGPCSLFEMAVHAGVRRIIQISALGADLHAQTRYWRSKARGDRCARLFAGEAVVVRPSLVYSPQGTSSMLFHRLAVMPCLPLPRPLGDIQPIHLEDLTEGLVALIEHPSPPPLIAAVGPVVLSMDAYMQALTSLSPMHRPRPRVPISLALRFARFVQRLPGSSTISVDALKMLGHPNIADAAPWAALLRRPLRRPEQFVEPARRDSVRNAAVLANMLPLLRLGVSLMWLVTAWVSVFVYPRAASIDLLVRAQVPPSLATSALYAAALLDAVLGLAMWVPRWRRLTLGLQMALVIFYSVVIGLWLPEYWAHPYGPMTKNLPLLAGTLLLFWLERPRGHRTD